MQVRDVELLAHQFAFVSDVESSIVALSGGMGAGKSYAIVAKACHLGSLNAPTSGLIVEPTFAMVSDILVPLFEECLVEWGVPYRYHETKHILTIGAGTAGAFKIYLRSGDKPKRIIGFNAGWGIIDEFESQDFDVFKRVLQRTRVGKSKHRQVALAGTPEGYGWGHELLEKKRKPGVRVIYARTRDNPHNGPEYEQRLRDHLSAAEADMYLDGKRTLREGRVYARFDRARHVRPCLDIRGQHFIGADFNHRKMAWLFAAKQGRYLHVWDELVREDSDTIEMCLEARRLLSVAYTKAYGRHIDEHEAAAMTTVVCDAAGAQESSNSKMSNVAILIKYGFRVMHPAANPFIDDRTTSLNLVFFEDRCHIDERAEYIVQCVETQPWGKDRKPQKLDDVKRCLSHGSDALGYLVFFLWPAWMPRSNDTRAGRGRRGADGRWNPDGSS